MLILFEHLLFFLFVLPFLMAMDGIKVLNNFLEKKGFPKIDVLEFLLFLFVCLFFVLLGLGYRW